MSEHELSWSGPVRFVAGLLVLCGCGGSSGFQQAAMREALTLGPPVVNDDHVAETLALRPQLPPHYRLGVYFREARSDHGEPIWRWEPKHKQAILGLRDALVASGQLADLFALDAALVPNEDLASIRLAAAKHGADAVLVVSGMDKGEKSGNGWAATYVALLPMLFVPGTELEELFFMHAEMWDVRNEYLYLAAEAEGQTRQTRALCFIDRKEAADKTQAEAVGLLAKELEHRFAGLHASASL